MCFSARYVPVVLLTFLSFGVSVCAQSPATQANKTPRGTVSGRITIKEKGAPGVSVGLRKADRSTLFEPFQRAITDHDGFYRITNVAPGSYEVTPAAPAFISTENNNSKTKTVVVGEDENVEGINFSLVRGGVITGKVIDGEGRPAMQQQVYVLRAESPEPSPQRPVFAPASAQTDDRGIYRVYGLTPGRYRAATGRSDDGAMGQFGSRRATYGQVFHPDVTDQTKATIIEVSEGSEASNVDIKLGASLQTFSVSGRVIDGEKGLPIPNIRFGFQRGSGSRVEFVNSIAVANAQGDFFAEGLIPGKYSVFLFANSNTELRAESAGFEIIDQDVSGVTVKLTKGASLAGVVVLESENKTALQRLLQLQLRALVVNPGMVGGFGQTSSSSISPDGSFRLAGLGPGRANIMLGSALGGVTEGFAIARVERDGMVQPRGGLEIKEGDQVTGLRIFVSYGTGKLRGVVKLQNGSLPPGAQLLVRLSRPGEGPLSIRPPQVDARGHFLVEGLPPGAYELMVSLAGGTATPAPRVRQEVSVQDGVVTEVVVTFDLAATPQP